MKKIYLLLVVALMVSMSLPAQVYYLLPNSNEWNSEDVTNPYRNTIKKEDQLQWEESDGHQNPERVAYEWFRDIYCDGIPLSHTHGTVTEDADTKRVITFKDLTDGRLEANGNLFSSVKVLWVNVDRFMDAGALDGLFPSGIRDRLANYVKAGGNLYLSTYASRLVYLIGRGPEPGFNANNGFSTCGTNDPWLLLVNFGAGYDYHGYRIFKPLNDNNKYGHNGGKDYDTYVMQSSSTRRTDRNCLWDIDDNTSAVSSFQDDHTCHVLGSWGHYAYFTSAGLVEFYPVGDWKGTVICNGLAACSFAEANEAKDNVKLLTQGILDYLSQRVTASWTTSPKATPIIKEEENVAITMSEHSSLSFTSSDVTKAEINAEGHISYNHFGNVTIKAVVTGDGENIPKNKVELSETRTVTGGTPAKYAYALPYSFYTMNNYPNEDGTWKPDYQAAKWFYDNYVVTGKGCFINPKNYSSLDTIPSEIQVLWVNNDHKDLNISDTLKSHFGDTAFVNALSAFVANGGNVFLSKQATRFIGDIGRAKWWPSYGVSREQQDDETWYMVDNFVAVKEGDGARNVNFHNHPVYATLRATKANQYTEHIWGDNNNEGYCKWPLFAGEGNRTKMTYIWGEPTDEWSRSYGMSSGTRTIEYATVTNFENNEGMKCKILGGWGHTTALDAVGFAEFPPETIDEKTFGGSVICIGLPAYQWSVGNTYIGNVRALTQGILDYLGGVVVVTEPETNLTNTTVNDLVVYQGGSVSNDEDITINNSITYIRHAVGGAAGNELGHWYTFCLPFTPTKCYIYDETDKADYEINSVYLKEGNAANNPQGEGSFYLQTFPRDADNNWTYIGNNGIPSKDTPYIIKFLNASEDGGKGSAWATYFTSNPTVKFKGGAQRVTGTDDGTGGDANGDYFYHVNKTLHKITLSNVYTLNAEGTYFEYDYGGTSTIMPFECYIKATSPAKALARPRIAIGPNKTQEETNTATDVESVYIDSLMPVAVYDLMGRMFYSGQMPETLPQGVWIIRQGSNSFKLINR